MEVESRAVKRSAPGEARKSWSFVFSGWACLNESKEGFHESTFPSCSSSTTNKLVDSRKGSTPYRANKVASTFNGSHSRFASARTAPAELAFQHIHREMDHGRPAVRTGARRI